MYKIKRITQKLNTNKIIFKKTFIQKKSIKSMTYAMRIE